MRYEFIGWCKEGKHDKIWGLMSLNDGPTYITFWGRRGAKLQTKVFEDTYYKARELCRKKQDKGYKEIVRSQLDTVYPEFQSDLEKTAIWAMLKV